MWNQDQIAYTKWLYEQIAVQNYEDSRPLSGLHGSEVEAEEEAIYQAEADYEWEMQQEALYEWRVESGYYDGSWDGEY